MSSNIIPKNNDNQNKQYKHSNYQPSHKSHASSELCGVLQGLHVVMGQQVRVLEADDLVIDADLINNSRCLTLKSKLDYKTKLMHKIHVHQ